MGLVSELDKKLKEVNMEVLQMELDAIFVVENNESRRMLTELKACRRRIRHFVREFYDGLLSVFSDCYDALCSLQRYVSSDMDGRFVALSKILATPVDSPEEEDLLGPEDLVDSISESHVKKRVFASTIANSKALTGEIKQELEGSKKTTLVEFLQVSENHKYFPIEWTCMDELRLRTIQIAILVSKLMVRFISLLASNGQLFRLLKSKIESIKNIPKKKCIVAERFVTLIEIAEDTMSQMKLKETIRSTTFDDEGELYSKMITHFYNAVMDLEWIMSFRNVPEKRELVSGARIRLQGVLGFVLYSMQGVRMKIKKVNCGKICRSYWAKMKSFIPELWKDMEKLPEKHQVQEQGVGEAGTSGAKPGDDSDSEYEEEESQIRLNRSSGPKIREEDESEYEEEESDLRLRRRRISRLRIIREEDEEETGDSLGTKDDEEADDPSGNQKDDRETADSSGKQVEEAGDASTDKKDYEEAGNSTGKKDDEAAADSSAKKDEKQAGESSGK